jgi:hypothetical protein
VAMPSQKSCRRMSSPPPASNARGRCHRWPGPRCPRSALAVGRAPLRTVSCRVRFASATQRSKRRVLGAGWEGGKFSSLRTIANKRNRVGIPPNPPGFRGSRRDSGEPLGALKGLARASGCGRRNFPIRKLLKTLEMAKESRRCRFPKADANSQ